jgi:hypothetical protein
MEPFVQRKLQEGKERKLVKWEDKEVEERMCELLLVDRVGEVSIRQ